MTPAEHHAILIRKAISEARAAGVNVSLDWDDDEDGIHVSLTTQVHRRHPEGWMSVVDGPWIVEAYRWEVVKTTTALSGLAPLAMATE